MKRPSGILALLPALALLLTAAAEPLPPEQATEHIVKSGETLMGIAARAKVPRVLIAEANGLQPPYTLRTGQKLKIPRTRRHTVRRGESGFGISYSYAVPWRAIAVANGLDPEAPLRPGQSLLIPTIIDQPEPEAPAPSPAASTGTATSSRFAWPVAGPVRRGYTPRSQSDYHDGLDITAAEGTTVRAAAAGKVVFAQRESRQFGNLVVIDHGDGWHTAYGFLSRITVKPDEQVNRGERIGLVGHTGLAKGAELHFEVRRNERPVNPDNHMPQR